MTVQDFFAAHPAAAVAFSGGVDSAWLLHEAVQYARHTAAYFVRTPFQPAFELADAQDTAHLLGADLTVLSFDVLSLPEVSANPADRCYFCKRALFTHLLEAARADGFPLVLDGSNASDDAEDRPGMRALAELGVRSPLRECGVTKSDVRHMAREAGLPVWDKPSYACLATRVPAGTTLTAGDLARVERGEAALMARGLSDFRLRLRGREGLLQVRAEQMALARNLLNNPPEALRTDFDAVALDPVPRESREN